MREPEARVYLARHAESTLNVDGHIIGGRSNNIPLTPHGVEQASQLGLFMRRTNLMPDYVFSSPAVRTRETTTIALEYAEYGHPVYVEDGVQELDQGEWTGLLRGEIYTPELLKEIEKCGKHFKAPGGESIDEAGIRMHDTINARVEELLHDTPLTLWFTTHSFAIKCLAGRIHNWSRHRIYNASVPNTSLTSLSRTKGNWKLEYLGRQTSK